MFQKFLRKYKDMKFNHKASFRLAKIGLVSIIVGIGIVLWISVGQPLWATINVPANPSTPDIPTQHTLSVGGISLLMVGYGLIVYGGTTFINNWWIAKKLKHTSKNELAREQIEKANKGLIDNSKKLQEANYQLNQNK